MTVRGVSPMAFQVRQGVKIVKGRQFTPGLYELVVGKQAADRYEGAQIGSTIKLQRRSWQVVGIFSSEGSGFESEIWGDVDVMGPAFNRSERLPVADAAAEGPVDGGGVRRGPAEEP